MLTTIEIAFSYDGMSKTKEVKALVDNGWALHATVGRKDPHQLTITHVASGRSVFSGRSWVARRGFRALMSLPPPPDDPTKIIAELPQLKDLLAELRSAPVYDVHRYAMWSIHVVWEDEHTLSLEDLWPDGDAPMSPTLEQVKKAYLSNADIPNGARVEVRPVDLTFAKRLAEATARARAEQRKKGA